MQRPPDGKHHGGEKNFWRCAGTYMSRGFCDRELHRAGESFPQLSRWGEKLLLLLSGNAPVPPLQTGATQNLTHKKPWAESTRDFHLPWCSLSIRCYFEILACFD